MATDKGLRKPRPRAVMLSKRANIIYLERVRVMQKDERVVYLEETGAEIEKFFNIPERNTAFLLLGKGTSITDAAARRLAESNVVVGFCGSGGSPLFGALDIAFLAPQSEYRPTQYMQAWVKAWFDEVQRLELAKSLLRFRVEITRGCWKKSEALKRQGVSVPAVACERFLRDVESSSSGQELLVSEALLARSLYRGLADAFRVDGFSREEGKGARETTADRINGFIDHGNYLAYGLAAVALNGLGISFSLPLLHGKTRRGALVFDVADLVKDAYVLPHAFASGAAGVDQAEFRGSLIETFQDEEALDLLFRVLEELCEKTL